MIALIPLAVRVLLELEAAEQSIRTEHVDELSGRVYAHRLELPLSLEFFVVLCVSNFSDAVSMNFLQGNQVVGHPLLEDWHVVSCVIAKGLDVDNYAWDAPFTAVLVSFCVLGRCLHG